MASPPPKTYKEQLYAWLGRRSRLIPDYNAYPDGTGHFISILSVPEYDLRTEGRAVKKSDAHEDAARKCVTSLRRQGKWDEADTLQSALPQPRSDETHLGETNPKSALNQYLQSIQARGKYTSDGPNTDGRFGCHLNIQLPSGPPMEFTDVGLSKVEAERACAKQALAKLQRRGLTEGPSVQDDGPRLEIPAPLPTPTCGSPPKRQWNKARPKCDNPKSLLNLFLQQNGVLLPNYVTKDVPDGKFRTSCQVDLKERGVSLSPDATASSKAESKKKCAEELICSLEKLDLIEQGRGSAVSDAPETETPSVQEVLRSLLPSLITNLGTAVAPPLRAGLETTTQAPLPNIPWPPVTPPAGSLVTTIIHGPVNVVNNNYQSGPAGSTPVSDALAMPQPTPPDRQRGRPRPVPEHLQALFESSELVSERHILKASRKIGELRKTIGLSLGLDQSDVDNCHFREENPCEVNRKILMAWRQKASRGATVGKLCTVLWDCEAYEAVRDLATVA